MLLKSAALGGRRKKRRKRSTDLDLDPEVAGTDPDQEAERGGGLEVGQQTGNLRNLAGRSLHSSGMFLHQVLST